MLVAVVMLFVVGAMAALSIDAVTIYTARSEAQLAADAAALAAARALANSGMTSDTTGGLTASAEVLASTVAIRVALQNQVGGSNLTLSDVGPPVFGGPTTNPTVTVHVKKSDLPTFFARIWGSTQVTVAASATAEVYNPSGANALGGATNPVAPTCVKPWLLPNIDPTSATSGTIFNPATGAITATPNLLGWASTLPTGTPMTLACGAPLTANPASCMAPLPAPAPWNYFPGDDVTFPHPTNALRTCAPALTTNYQESIAGCIATPIACNGTVNIDTSAYGTRNAETADAVNCLTHAQTGNGDTIISAAPPATAFQFVAGADNPIAGLAGNNLMVSDSLVTVPVFDVGSVTPYSVPPNPVQIVGFVQLFLNPDGLATPATGSVNTTVINMAGCGTGASGTPILGNGASPVAVRLISP
jgi:hypothetical protein